MALQKEGDPFAKRSVFHTPSLSLYTWGLDDIYESPFM